MNKFCPQINSNCVGEKCINFSWDNTEIKTYRNKPQERIKKPYCNLYKKLI